jgi:hypothetical protein
MAKGILDLAVAITPEHVLYRLTDFRAGGDGLREDGVSVGDLKGEHYRSAAY